MRFNVYPEGSGSRAVVLTANSPDRAARFFAEEFSDAKDGATHLVVTPEDDVAKALLGWDSDTEEPMHRLYMVEPYITPVEWTARRVKAFRGPEAGK